MTGTAALTALDGARSRMRVKLQQAIDTAQQSRALPTAPGVAGLLPGGALRAGATYAVSGSTSLVAALMAGPSGDGAWCGVVGLPAFGAEAAAGLGVDLDRVVLVPRPEREWLNVVAALVDALTVVVVRPPGRVSPAEASRLAARMRKRGSVVVATGTYAQAWPGAEARLRVEQSSWSGLGEGTGYLTGRQATVAVTGRGTAVRPRLHRLWLPGPDGTVAPVAPAVAPATRPTRLPTAHQPDLPTARPSDLPTARPSDLPTACPSDLPITRPSDLPTGQPLAEVPDLPAWQEEAVG